jgi:hypothetical protein
MRLPAVRAGCLLPVLALAWASETSAQQVGVGTGVSHLSGRFGGTERSQIQSVYVSLNAVHGDWRADATLPYLRIAGVGGIDVGGIIVPIEGLGPSEGIGDLTLRVTRSLGQDLNLPVGLSLAGQVKLPTGKSNVSTGKADFLPRSRVVAGRRPFLAHPHGRLPLPWRSGFLQLNDGWSLSAGSGVAIGKVFLAASYEWSESVVGGPNPQEAFLLAAGPITPGWSWNLFASKGLNSGAADYGIGAGFSRSFGRKPSRPVSAAVPSP